MVGVINPKIESIYLQCCFVMEFITAHKFSLGIKFYRRKHCTTEQQRFTNRKRNSTHTKIEMKMKRHTHTLYTPSQHIFHPHLVVWAHTFMQWTVPTTHKCRNEKLNIVLNVNGYQHLWPFFIIRLKTIVCSSKMAKTYTAKVNRKKKVLLIRWLVVCSLIVFFSPFLYIFFCFLPFLQLLVQLIEVVYS